MSVLDAPVRVPVSAPSRATASRSAPWAVLALLFAAGAGAIVVATAGLSTGPMALRWFVGVAGTTALYQAYRGAGRRLFGAGWDPALWLAGTWLVLLVGAVLAAPILPLAEYEDTAATISTPSLLRPDLFSGHPLGTNNLGLDMLARSIIGARSSLLVAVAAVVMGIVVGGSLGMVSGYVGGKVGWAVGIVNNTLLSFPPLVLLLALAAVMERNSRNVAVALGILAIPVNVRIARANTLALVDQGFVVAARAMGTSRRRVLVREVMPNVAPSLVSYGLVLMAILIVAEASLSFLGLGVPPPAPSWGNMISEGDGGLFETNPHLVVVPGAVIFLTVFAFNLVGGRARQRFDQVGAGR